VTVAEDDRSSAQSEDTTGGRVPGSRVRTWLLLDANRWVVASIPLAGVFAALVVLGSVDPVPLRAAIRSGDPVETAFQGFLTAIITGVTLVVTINQLVLSQELGAVGDQRDRMAGAVEFRQEFRNRFDEPVGPPDPASFLRVVVDVTGDRAETLADAVSDGRDAEFGDQVDSYVDELTANADAVADRLDDAQFGTFDVLSAALDFDYSWRIYEARRLRNEHENALSEEAVAAFDALLEALEFYAPTREHFKTLYFQWELIDLSRMLMYAALPALVVATGMILYVDDPNTVTGTTLGVDNVVWLVSAAVAVALVPFVLLLSYILRIATVAKRTLAIGPFVLQEIERPNDAGREE
jgi:hypothetical protein